MIPPRVRLATLLAFLSHGIFIIAARYHSSYDAYVHMFFGDHYLHNWWSLWDPRWYTGFPVSSYPPLAHQLIGLLSHLVGLDAAFASVLWLTVTLFPASIYAFSLVFVKRPLAEIASLGAAFLPSIYLSAHIFGQLPFLFSTAIALLGGAALAGYLQAGGRLNAALSTSLMALVMASHHAVLLLLPVLVVSISLHLLLIRRVTWVALLRRLAIFGVSSGIAMLIVVWPFWQWGQSQSMQVPIDHLSRHNFLKDWLAPAIFFFPMYGTLLFLVPSLPRLLSKRHNFSLTLSFIFLFVLGLGGTTPVPHWLFGRNWEWLTYDRFALWASIFLLPFLGSGIFSLRRPTRSSRLRTLALPLTLGSLAIVSFLIGEFTTVLPIQPGAVDMKPIVRFLAQKDHAGWRYLTFGFGDQLALLSTMTNATTIDGSYHTARNLPELRTSGIAQIDTAYWSSEGLDALDPILQTSSARGVRWGFVNVPFYSPVLQRNGWVQIATIAGGVEVWENPAATRPPPSPPPPVLPLASFSWGTFPLLSLVTASALGALRLFHLHASRILTGIHAFLVGLIPIGICFWYYRPLASFSHARVYFTYDQTLFFLADALTLTAVVLWLTWRLAESNHRPLSRIELLLLAFCIWASFSVLWSVDWRTSALMAIHLWLVFALICSLRDWPAWRALMLGFAAALSIQAFTGLLEFGAQSTALLAPLKMRWPGLLDPSVRGASVVGLPGGGAFLRAYGTLPHPNILGGIAFACILGPVALYLRRGKSNRLYPVLLFFGISLIAISFSRSAWLAILTFALILAWKSRYFERKRLIILALAAGFAGLVTLLPLHSLVEARTLNAVAPSEEFSGIARSWLSSEALGMIRAHPLTGVGIGSFVLQLARQAGEGYIIEPAHNLILLASSELGIPGLLLLLSPAIVILQGVIKATHPERILIGASLAGLGVISLFDHYLWTLAPSRLMLALVLGLWVGQGGQDA